MAERNPPLYLEGGTYHAADDRQLINSIFPYAGVMGANDMLVSVSSGMTVAVAVGRGIIVGTTDAAMGSYAVYNETATNLTLDTSDPTNPRIDLIVGRVYDGAYTGTPTDMFWRLDKVKGTPAASPVTPAVTADSIVLAAITVPAGASAIIAGNIADLRTRVDRPWRMPWGEVAFVEKTATQTIGTTTTDISGMSVTFTAIQNRRYLFEAIGQVKGNTGGTRPIVRLATSGNVQRQQFVHNLAGANYYTNFKVLWRALCTSAGGTLLPPGSTTMKLRADTNANTITFDPSATVPMQFVVQDIGPATLTPTG